MKAGDTVRISLCSGDWRKADGDKEFVFIGEGSCKVLICRAEDIRYVNPGAVYPVRHCKECGRELPETAKVG